MTAAPAPAWAAHLPPGVDPARLDLTGAGSLPAAWAARWRSRPDRAVVRDPDGTWATGADLLARTAAVAGRLAAAGLVPGDRVLVSGPASVDLVVAHCAALRAGYVVVPVNAAYTARELAVIAGDARPRAAVLGDADLRAAAAAPRPRPAAGGDGTDVDLPDGSARRSTPWRPGDPALLPYTSGTTGTPKGRCCRTATCWPAPRPCAWPGAGTRTTA